MMSDDVHGRHCNSSEINSDLFLQKSETNFNDSHRLSMGFHHISRKWFHIKWNELDPQYWNFSNIINIQNFFFKENMLYPYFEFKINPNLYEINKPS